MSNDRTGNPNAAGGQNFDAFRAAVSAAVVALDVNAEHPEAFHGGLKAGATGDIHLLGIRADSHSVHRTESLISRSPQRYLKFSLIEHGSGLIVQEGREALLRAGDMAVYDTDRPYSLVFDDDVRMSLVMFPRELLDIPTEALHSLTAKRFNGSSDIGRMIRPYLGTLTQRIDGLEHHVARRLFRTAFDLVGTMLEAELGNAAQATAHDADRRRILEFIDGHLSDQVLNPTQIAAAHFMSVRHLHALFNEHGTTISTVIRTRRLDRAYSDLVNPLLASRSVIQIALDNGFADGAHFSRTFRRQFGTPPSRVRSTQLG